MKFSVLTSTLFLIICSAPLVAAQTTPLPGDQSAQEQARIEQEIRRNQMMLDELRRRTINNGRKGDNRNSTPALNSVTSENLLTAKERTLLEPSASDRQQYAEFLKQPGTGIFKLLSAEKSATTGAVTTNDSKPPFPLIGGGAYYSFTKRNHDVSEWCDVRLLGEMIQTGFVNNALGAMTILGDVPLEAFTIDSPGVAALASFIPPTKYTDAVERQTIRGSAGDTGGFIYKSALPASNNTTYALRSISYKRSDRLIIFRVVRQDDDGSLTIIWKQLKSFPAPKLIGVPKDSRFAAILR